MKITSICVICGIYPGFPTDSAGIFIANLIKAFAYQGMHCIVIRPVSVTKALLRKKNLPPFYSQEKIGSGIVEEYSPRTLSFGNLQLFGKQISQVLFKYSVEKTFRNIDTHFDLIYSHFLSSGEAAYALHLATGIPFFTALGESNFNELIDTKNSRFLRDFFRHCAGMIAVSHSIKKAIVASTGNDEKIASKIIVEPNGVDTQIFRQLDKYDIRKQLGIPLDDIVILFVGSLIQRKGARRLAAAVDGLENTHVYFIGNSGDDVPEEKANIHLCGSMSPHNVAAYLNAADFFVLPTLAEGCCNAIVEAMACGLPIISSNRDFNEGILDDQCAILLDPLDISAIRDAIITLSNDSTLRKKMSEAALRKAQFLDITQRAQRILSFMEDQIKNG